MYHLEYLFRLVIQNGMGTSKVDTYSFINKSNRFLSNLLRTSQVDGMSFGTDEIIARFTINIHQIHSPEFPISITDPMIITFKCMRQTCDTVSSIRTL